VICGIVSHGTLSLGELSNAPTYIDYPLRKLTAVVPTLDGMKADSSQDQLTGILSKVGEATVRSLSTVPNLSSRDVYSIVLARDP